jgi:bifunctional pyridoxal-dependent enzyme with beta-cystathionase and maltose regulon repressor activities
MVLGMIEPMYQNPVFQRIHELIQRDERELMEMEMQREKMYDWNYLENKVERGAFP